MVLADEEHQQDGRRNRVEGNHQAHDVEDRRVERRGLVVVARRAARCLHRVPPGLSLLTALVFGALLNQTAMIGRLSRSRIAR